MQGRGHFDRVILTQPSSDTHHSGGRADPRNSHFPTADSRQVADSLQPTAMRSDCGLWAVGSCSYWRGGPPIGMSCGVPTILVVAPVPLPTSSTVWSRLTTFTAPNGMAAATQTSVPPVESR